MTFANIMWRYRLFDAISHEAVMHGNSFRIIIQLRGQSTRHRPVTMKCQFLPQRPSDA